MRRLLRRSVIIINRKAHRMMCRLSLHQWLLHLLKSSIRWFASGQLTKNRQARRIRLHYAVLRCVQDWFSLQSLWLVRDYREEAGADALREREEMVQRALDREPTLLVAPDFLFWYAYGQVSEEAVRPWMFGKALELLRTLGGGEYGTSADLRSAEQALRSRGKIPAIKRYRDLLGATNPAEAAPGTIRADFGTDVEKNATHGSDAPETAAEEISFFFAGLDL